MERLDPINLKSLLPARDPESSKKDFGKLAIIAGSYGMAGAAIYCGQGAMRSGVGLATFLASEELMPVLQTACPEVMFLDRDMEVLPAVLADSGFTGLVIGPGLGRVEAQSGLLKGLFASDLESAPIFDELADIFEGNTLPTVVDADGLNAMAKIRDILDAFIAMKVPKVITPHEGEAARLLHAESIKDREAAAVTLAKGIGGVAVLKGHRTLIATPEGKVFENITGDVGLATGGTGDVLTGLIGGFLAQGLSAEAAAKLGVYLHGLAGDLCQEDLTAHAMTARDLPNYLPQAFKQLIES